MSDDRAPRRAVFLDREGVLVEDTALLSRPEQVTLLDGVPGALARLKAAGFALVVVSNQAVVARGLTTLEGVARVNAEIAGRITSSGGPALDGVYVCPHHPHADVADYRLECQCRKPRPGLLTRAAAEHGLDLAASFLVGDRPTDIAAGAAAGCRTILVETGRHADAPIVTVDALDPGLRPDHVCAGLADAARWIAEVADARAGA